MQVTDTRPPNLENLEAFGEELADDLLELVAGGKSRREPIISYCLDDEGNIVDYAYIDVW